MAKKVRFTPDTVMEWAHAPKFNHSSPSLALSATLTQYESIETDDMLAKWFMGRQKERIKLLSEELALREKVIGELQTRVRTLEEDLLRAQDTYVESSRVKGEKEDGEAEVHLHYPGFRDLLPGVSSSVLMWVVSVYCIWFASIEVYEHLRVLWWAMLIMNSIALTGFVTMGVYWYMYGFGKVEEKVASAVAAVLRATKG